MAEDIGTNSGAATIEIVGKLVVIFLCTSVHITHEFILFQYLLMNISGFQGIDSNIRCFLTLLSTLFMQFVNYLFCPVFTNNLIINTPTNFKERMVERMRLLYVLSR